MCQCHSVLMFVLILISHGNEYIHLPVNYQYTSKARVVTLENIVVDGMPLYCTPVTIYIYSVSPLASSFSSDLTLPIPTCSTWWRLLSWNLEEEKEGHLRKKVGYELRHFKHT